MIHSIRLLGASLFTRALRCDVRLDSIGSFGFMCAPKTCRRIRFALAKPQNVLFMIDLVRARNCVSLVVTLEYLLVCAGPESASEVLRAYQMQPQPLEAYVQCRNSAPKVLRKYFTRAKVITSTKCDAFFFIPFGLNSKKGKKLISRAESGVGGSRITSALRRPGQGEAAH